jgi:tetratricopeptide (TPR) repeat protein
LNYEGNIALSQSKYDIAKQKYHASLEAARENGDKQYEAISMYGLGQVYGRLCEFNESEKWFIKSIELRSNLQDSNVAYQTQNILELARLYKSAQLYNKANTQYEKAIPMLESLNIRTSDPIGYADVLKDYVVTLSASGKEIEAKEISELIENLKSNNPNRRAGFTAVQYPTNCNK